MSELQAVVLLVAGVLLAYFLGLYVGRVRHFELVEKHLTRATNYQRAVNDLDKWCGHTSPHARR